MRLLAAGQQLVQNLVADINLRGLLSLYGVTHTKYLTLSRYGGFTARHFHEHLARDHGFRRGYTWTKTFLHRRRLIGSADDGNDAASGRLAARRIPDLPASFDLVITLDDATGGIYPALLVDEEARRRRSRRGSRCSAGTACRTACIPTGAAMTSSRRKPARSAIRTSRPRVGRALAQPGIEHISACSPEARGRCERAFCTLQDRLPKELALAGITSVEEANRFLREVCLAAHNARFAVAAGQPGAAFVAVDPDPSRYPVHPGATSGRQRQHGALQPPALADSAEPDPAALWAGQGAGSPLSGWRLRRLSRPPAAWPATPATAAGKSKPTDGVTRLRRPRLWIRLPP
jgi:hypothetical protein